MIQKQSILTVLDNSGILFTKCIGLYNKKKFASQGNIVLVSVKKKGTALKSKQVFKKGEILKALMVQQRKTFKRFSNFFLRFDSNSIILLNSQEKPLATRIKGLIPRELRKKSFLRLASLAGGVI